MAVGDLRNKMAKIEGRIRDKAAMNRFLGRPDDWVQPPTPKPPLPRCACGLTFYDTVLVAYQPDRWKPAIMVCRACTPPDLVDPCWPEKPAPAEEPPPPARVESTMPAARTFKVHRRKDGKFESRDADAPATDSPLGVDSNLSMAIGTAHREAKITAQAERRRVHIKVENADGGWSHQETVEPPR